MRWIIAGLLFLSLSGCGRILDVPRNAGVCWRLAPAMNGKDDFRPLSTGVENLETCAVQLEGLHLVQRRPIVGGFQGRIIYVDARDITVAANPNAQRYRVFSPEQRSKIDTAFRDLGQR
jgi:hypothetical protein